MIATRNRAGELRKTLECCRNNAGIASEVLVVDDASTDGTAEMVSRDFPEVDFVRREFNRGSIAARNDILQRARGKYVIGLDDDSRFVDADSCWRIVERMNREPDLGIISFQVIGPEFPERMNESGRLRGEWHTSSFAACGVAIRRALFERTGMLPEYFFHTYEEPDLCLRAWDAGYRVLQWNDILVYHEFSPLNRKEQRNHRQHARNETCSIWMRYPWHLVLPATAHRVISQSRYAMKRGWLLREPRVWLETMCRLPYALWNRKPVSEKAVKIAIAVNRFRISDPRKVWDLADVSWRQILSGSPNGFDR